jgi:hypothetical protein
MESQARAALADQDLRGRWLTDNALDMDAFERNLNTLAEYLRLTNDR